MRHSVALPLRITQRQISTMPHRSASGTISVLEQLNCLLYGLDQTCSTFVAGLERLRFQLRGWWAREETS